MPESQGEVELIDILNVIWRRKALIIIPTLILVIAATVVSSLMPKIWEVSAIIQPSKFLTQNEQGQFEEIVVLAPEQIASQINEATYNELIAAELNLNISNFPHIRARSIRDTNLVSVSIRNQIPQQAESILLSLFNHLKGELDKKIDVENKSIDTEKSKKENQIILNDLVIEDYQNEIKIRKIDKDINRQEIETAKNKITISEGRVNSIVEEMKSVKDRTNALAKQQEEALAERNSGNEGISLFLLIYSTTIQQNMQYYNTLDQELNNEKVKQADLNLLIKEKTEENKQLDTQIEKLKTEISKVKNRTEDIKSEITLLIEKKARIDYAQLIKEPTVSLNPVSPRRLFNVFITGFLSFLFFLMLAFLIEYIKTKAKEQKSV